ncbi:hypothetical protein KFK09_023772 [Dendrobium nobile]|uniref:Glycosyltransferase n=1 Tax=Dendrobium nobile TaxID=94219 RepID=A0A8T3AC80_DENNO|nr:hypothetical protein KFK09_023772 [Dendrobium nobile]
MISLTNPQESTAIAVVMVPLPMQGHLNPLLHLSAHLATRGIAVHYVSSATHNRQASQRFHGWNLSSSSSASSSHLHFHDLPFTSLPLPSPYRSPNSATTKFPSHHQASFDASTSQLLPHLSPILLSLSLSHRRVVLLHDSSMSFANAAASPNIESFSFHTSSAISNLFFLGKSELCQAKLISCFGEEFLDWVWQQRRIPIAVKGRIFNTCRSIEGEFLNQLSSETAWKGQRIFSIGPLNPILADRGRSDERCLKWLDRQPVASVVYVSFGTTATMTREQEKEIAAGLEESGERFIWVRREADRCNIFETEGEEEEEEDSALAELEERSKGRIVVVRGWAPQLQILAHPSTGGFLSHCGWNSCMEAMSNGVPILAWPIHSDQPTNTVLVTKILKVGMVVKEWSDKDEVVAAATVKDAVVKLMVGDEGREVRKKAREVGESLRAAVVDGGSSKEDFDEFVNYICRP